MTAALESGAHVVAVCRSPRHRFSKEPVAAITLIEGVGVEGDAHAGATVQHRSRKRWRPDLPNLRQVHLLHAELLAELDVDLAPGDVGENVLTREIDLLGLPTGARLHLGASAVVGVTGLRNPCVQLDRFADGLTGAMVRLRPDGTLDRLAGIMGVILAGGEVRAGDAVVVELPAGVPVPLKPV